MESTVKSQDIYNAVATRWLSGDISHPREIVGDRPPHSDRKAQWVYDCLVSVMSAYGFPKDMSRHLRQVAHTCHLDFHPDVSPYSRIVRRNIGVTPNRGASMNTRFGKTIEDPDEIGGHDGRAVDEGMNLYERFHAKEPIRVAELDHDVPTSWSCVGDALSVMYRTDKWKPDGDDEDYKHLHDAGNDKPYPIRRGVRFYEPSSEVSKSTKDGQRVQGGRGSRLPVAIPRAVALLGYCLGAFVRLDEDGEEYEVNPRGCYLFSAPSGKVLFIYSPKEGFLGAMSGGNLRVLKDGIDG